MDNSTELKLFDNDGSEVALPSISQDASEDSKELISASIDSKILGDKVKVIDIPEDTAISEENFIFDFSELEAINIIQKNSLKSLISDEDGDVQLYLYNKKAGLVSFGFGEKYKLEKIIPLIRFHIFDNKIKIYKNYKIGTKPIEVENADITKLRLNL